MNDIYGQNWLLLRGLGRDSRHWGNFIPLLKNAFPTANIHTLDLPGTGESMHLNSPMKINHIVEQLRQQALQKNLLETPLTFLGLSLAGMVTWHWGCKYPQDMNAGIMINSSFANLSPFYRRLRWQSLLRVGQIIISNKPNARELAIVRLISNLNDPQRQKIAKTWSSLHQQNPIKKSNVLRQLIAAASFCPSYTATSVPFLLISSSSDRMVDFSCSQAIQNKFNIPLVCHPSAGHDLPLDDGSWLIEQCQNWFLSLEGK